MISYDMETPSALFAFCESSIRWFTTLIYVTLMTGKYLNGIWFNDWDLLCIFHCIPVKLIPSQQELPYDRPLTHCPLGDTAVILKRHYNDIIMLATASQILCVLVVYTTVCSYADQRKHQSSASLPLVRGIHRGPVNFGHKQPLTRKMFSFGDVIMVSSYLQYFLYN